MTNSNIKKEVSCKILPPLFYALGKKELNPSLILKDIPYSLAHLKNKHERIEWAVYCKIICNCRAYFTQSEFENIGAIKYRGILS